MYEQECVALRRAAIAALAAWLDMHMLYAKLAIGEW
jgi:hypothetical protein